MEITRSTSFPATASALQQSDEYARAVTHLGGDAEAYVAHDQDHPIARVQIVKRRFGPLPVFWVPRGPVWAQSPCPDTRARLWRVLPQIAGHGMWIVAPDSADDLAAIRHTQLMSPQHVAEIDLTADDGTRLSRQHVKWRNRLRHAQNTGLQVAHRRFDPLRDQTVLIREATQQRKHRYRGLPPAFVLAWAQTNRSASRLFTVSHEGKAVAHMLLLLHRPVVTYHIGWSGMVGRRHSAHNLALWAASQWLHRKGFARLDLGSVDTEHAPGLARFKIGSGATVRPLGATSLHLPHLSRRRLIRHDAA
ncbi:MULTISPECIES: GNAT family N-acetyltransferase [unclassified Roseovarius]|uniref:GNAT family N-acetyltransferase n=1 Tax=unclassified Roseovarius TaxID=2614913 RepID=UPI00273EC108|nr:MULTISPECIES: GNAT family N-acetyltransferase [unclassified Roseovarius]